MENDSKKKSKVLVIGGTGRLGQELIKASVAAQHPTFALIRNRHDDATSDNQEYKTNLIQSFAALGVTILYGSLQHVPTLVEAVKLVDVVICAIPAKHALQQFSLIQAIKLAGSIKRFIPSEFGADPDKVQILGMDYDFYEKKAEIRRCIEKEGIPYTYVSCNFLMRYLLPSLIQPGQTTPPRDEVKIFGTGDVKAVFVEDSDVASYTICTIDDPRTLNKIVYLRPPSNVLSQNELVRIWESKIGKELVKVNIPEEELLASIQDTPYPDNMELIFIYSAFVKGDQTYFSMESAGLDGTQLYPHVNYTTISDYLDTLL